MTPPRHRFDSRFPNLKGTIIIVTYGRSGSTLLQSVIQTIPGAHIGGENFNVIEPLWQAVRRTQQIRNRWGRKERPANFPWYGADRVRPHRFAGRLVDAFVDEVIRPPADATWFGFKEIRYNALGDNFGQVLDFMAQHFKNCHFVFNSRRAEDVARSSWWADWKQEDVFSLVHTMDRRFQSYAEAHPQNCHHIFYDDLVQDHSTIAPLFGKLGEPYDEERLRAVMEVRLSH